MNTGPSLQDAGLVGPGNRSGSIRKGAATLAIKRSLMTKEPSVCRTPLHLSNGIVTDKNQHTRSLATSLFAVVSAHPADSPSFRRQ